MASALGVSHSSSMFIASSMDVNLMIYSKIAMFRRIFNRSMGIRNLPKKSGTTRSGHRLTMIVL